MRKTAIFRNELFIKHDPGLRHPESPDRLKTLFRALDASPLRSIFLEPDFSEAAGDLILLNHSRELLTMVASTAGSSYGMLDGDTFTSAKSYEAACLAVGAALRGVDLLFTSQIDNGFAMVRPPGHHAEQSRSMGFCLFNNVALAARWAIEHYGVERVLVLDWDVHHGNGTQNSFYETDQVLYISIHQSPLYPGTGSLYETGKDRGSGYTINIPLPGGQGDTEYANVFNRLIVPIALQYKPQLILISAGFDAYHADAISGMNLNHQTYGYMTKVMMEVADAVCDGRLLVLLEGGYNLTGLRDGVFSVLAQLVGQEIDPDSPFLLDKITEDNYRKALGAYPGTDRVRDVAKKFWKL